MAVVVDTTATGSAGAGSGVTPVGTPPAQGNVQPVATEPPGRAVPSSLVVMAIGVILVGAWGGIVPFVGPLFGFSGNGGPAWSWTESHALLALVPGAVAVVAGLLLLGAAAPRTGGGKARFSLSFLGAVIAACGGWFAIGPFAWIVLRPSDAPYFSATAPYTALMHQLGYAVGPGLVLVLFGGAVLGWAMRHHRPAVERYPVAVPVTPAASVAAGTARGAGTV